MPYRLRLHFEDAAAFREALARSLAMGGAFVPTGDPLKLGSVVEVEVAPRNSGERILLEAQVVHVVPLERALQPLEAGAVVAFLAPEEELREKLAPYLDGVDGLDGAEDAEGARHGGEPDAPGRRLSYPAHARFRPRMHSLDSERLSPLEASLIELATVGLPASRIFEVIPEETSAIQEALEALIERGVLRVA